MIVRISGEEQYELPDQLAEELNQLEQPVLASIEEGRQADFTAAYHALLDFVRANGSVVHDDDIQTSNVILPPADLSFEEAGREFTGEGLIPD